MCHADSKQRSEPHVGGDAPMKAPHNEEPCTVSDGEPVDERPALRLLQQPAEGAAKHFGAVRH